MGGSYNKLIRRRNLNLIQKMVFTQLAADESIGDKVKAFAAAHPELKGIAEGLGLATTAIVGAGLETGREINAAENNSDCGAGSGWIGGPIKKQSWLVNHGFENCP